MSHSRCLTESNIDVPIYNTVRCYKRTFARINSFYFLEKYMQRISRMYIYNIHCINHTQYFPSLIFVNLELSVYIASTVIPCLFSFVLFCFVLFLLIYLFIFPRKSKACVRNRDGFSLKQFCVPRLAMRCPFRLSLFNITSCIAL